MVEATCESLGEIHLTTLGPTEGLPMGKLRQIGTIRFNGEAYPPSRARDLAKILPKEDFKRLSTDPTLFEQVEEGDEDEVSSESPDIDSLSDIAELRKLRRTATAEDKAKIDARISSLGG